MTMLGRLITAFPSQYPIYYRKDTPFTTFGTPTAIRYDDGKSGSLSFKSPQLQPGTWYVVVHQTNEDGTESDSIVNQSVTIVKVPASPGVPYYYSGGASATVIRFVGSTDISSTYNYYDSNVNGVISTIPTTTGPAGNGTISFTLPALTDLTFTGTRYVFARALLNGIESGNSTALAIAYVNGTVIPLLPNVPSLRAIRTVGKQLAVDFSLDMLNQDATPDRVQLFASETTNFDWNTELAHQLLGTVTTRFVLGTVTGTVSTNGIYYFAIRTATSAGIQSANTNYYGPIRLTSEIPPDPIATVTGSV